MNDGVSAQILQFPRRPAPKDTANQRLGAALEGLSEALTNQQQAIKRWREALSELAGCMQHLSDNLRDTAQPKAPAS